MPAKLIIELLLVQGELRSNTPLTLCRLCFPVTNLWTVYSQLPQTSSDQAFLLHFDPPALTLTLCWTAVKFYLILPFFHIVIWWLQWSVVTLNMLFSDFWCIYLFYTFPFNKATGACLPSAVWTVPEFWRSPAPLHPAVPSWAGVGILAHHGQQGSSEQRVHRGPSLGHL